MLHERLAQTGSNNLSELEISRNLPQDVDEEFRPIPTLFNNLSAILCDTQEDVSDKLTRKPDVCLSLQHKTKILKVPHMTADGEMLTNWLLMVEKAFTDFTFALDKIARATSSQS